jgi:pentatricopeptide repeat protein
VLLDACINCRQVDRAIALFKQIKSDNPNPAIKPDEISFNTIIKGCA